MSYLAGEPNDVGKWLRAVAAARDLLDEAPARCPEVARASWLLDRLEDDMRRRPTAPSLGDGRRGLTL